LTLRKHFFVSHTIGPTDILHTSPAPHFKTSKMLGKNFNLPP